MVSGGTTVAFDTPFAVTPQIKLSVVAYCCSLAPPQVSSIVTQVTAEGASFVLPAPYTFVRIVYHASRSGQYHPPLPPPPVFRLAYIVMCTGWETLTRARTHTFHSPPLHLSTSPTIPPLLLPSPLHLSPPLSTTSTAAFLQVHKASPSRPAWRRRSPDPVKVTLGLLLLACLTTCRRLEQANTRTSPSTSTRHRLPATPSRHAGSSCCWIGPLTARAVSLTSLVHAEQTCNRLHRRTPPPHQWHGIASQPTTSCAQALRRSSPSTTTMCRAARR